jgi:membrane protein required for colicin V production
MTIFDAIVIGLLLAALVMGYRAGLLRSLATIFGYVLAAPVTIAITPKLVPLFSARMSSAGEQNGLLFVAVFVVAGLLSGALLRSAVSFVAGEDVSVPDRLAGATLGGVRVVLLAILMVLMFDHVLPAKRQPAWFAQSQLRPILSAAGAMGVRNLPPTAMAQIDRLKKERGI